MSLDTSGAAGSAAIVRDGTIVIERAGDPSRTHGERLPRELMSLLDAGGLRLDDIDAFGVCTGPGSFTGLRVGIATIQGLALARNKLITPVSAFEALAMKEWASNLQPRTSLVAVWLDAQRKEVFAALYDQGQATLIEPSSMSPAATLDAWGPALENGASVRFAGDGAVKYADVIRARLGSCATIATAVPPLAGVIGQIAAAEPARAVRPHAVVPLYVRRSDAELARDRRDAANRP